MSASLFEEVPNTSQTSTNQSSSDTTKHTEEESKSHPTPTPGLDLKHKIFILLSIIVILYIGISFSIILSVILAILLSISVLFIWFSSTNLSVEITVFLAKFFPPSKYATIKPSANPNCEWTKKFRDNYKIIHNEYLEFEKKYNYRPQMDDVYPNGSITNWDRKWPTVNLRCYGLDTEISKYFPKTMKLVNNSDCWLSHVMFSILKSNKFIPRHRGPYRGVFRYQLHLEIPECTDYTKELYLAVWENTSSHEFWSPENVPPGTPKLLTWKNGDDFLFDDTCVHEVINFTKKRRIILFCDAERYDLPTFAKCLHKIFMRAAKYLPAVTTMKKVQDEYLNKYKNGRYDEKETNQNSFNFSDFTNGYMKYSSPEILPYTQARVVIQNNKLKRSQSDRDALINKRNINSNKIENTSGNKKLN